MSERLDALRRDLDEIQSRCGLARREDPLDIVLAIGAMPIWAAGEVLTAVARHQVDAIRRVGELEQIIADRMK